MGSGKGRMRRAQSSSATRHLGRGFAEDGAGWVECELGHEHWGIYGAAGLMIKHVDAEGQERYLLTHRSRQVHYGGTYSLPGGAIDSYETPEEAAERECVEELGQLARLTHVKTEVVDHGGWAYHTVHVDAEDMFDPSISDDDESWETDSAGWFTPEEIDGLPLHPGFRAYWESIKELPKNS